MAERQCPGCGIELAPPMPCDHEPGRSICADCAGPFCVFCVDDGRSAPQPPTEDQLTFDMGVLA